jgi:enamine deaminase RidA (YjgF/YER057c/UK114 family)
MDKTKQTVSSGMVWEARAGYSRAVRVGDHIYVSGTTATGPNGVVGGNDPAAQARFVLEKIEQAILELGGRVEDVVRTRVFLGDVANWEPVARVHGERFGEIRPANTMLHARPLDPEMLVEIEAEAIVGAGDGAGSSSSL